MEKMELLQRLARVEQQISDEMEIARNEKCYALDGKGVDNEAIQIMSVV
jgi:hypothetical protein